MDAKWMKNKIYYGNGLYKCVMCYSLTVLGL